MSCTTNITIPTLPTDPCNGKQVSTKCLINESAIPSLFLEPNSTQEEVNNALVLATNSLINRVEDLEESQETETIYKTYRALLTQSGTDAPTAKVLQNELSGTVIFTRDNQGRYSATLSSAFTVDKTFVTITPMDSSLNKIISLKTDVNTVSIQTYSADETAFLDSVLLNTEFQILVYN